MNKQRGVIATGYLILAGALALLAMLWGLTHAVTSYLGSVRAEAEQAGKDTCDAAYKARDNAALKVALDRVKALEEQARLQEAQNAKDMEATRLTLAKEIQNGKTTEKRVIADIASGKLWVRTSAFQGRDCSTSSGGSTKGEVGKPSTGDNGSSTCKLSPETEGRVLAIGTDADNVAKQLTAAQQVILSDRVLCNVP